MGSSGEPNTKRIDATVGGLVWVRRRNGSWWPGRIMGLDELSEGCLVSPRSGTPVKLLGREDASVDWYNLEKSKRVKAFRCGDYDDCIEKAKAAANSNKKAVKYARREDAILHALELENTRFGRDQPDLCLRSKGSGGEDGGWARDSPTMSHSAMSHSADETDDSEEVSDSEDSSSSAQELSQSGISFQEPNNISVPKVESVRGRRRRTPNDSEDDGIEGTKRMRGLEDLGMGVVSKRKIQAGGVLEQLQQDNALLGDSTNGKYMSVGTGSPTNGSKGHFLSLKRKRTQVAHVHEFLKRKNRRRPLTKVLESTAMVSVPVMCDELVSPCGSPLNGVSDSKVSGLESNESKKTFSVINNSSDSTGVSFENGVSLNASEHACDASHNHKLKENGISCMSGFLDDDSSDKLFDVPFVGEEKHSAGFSHIFALSSRKPQVSTLGRESNQGSQVETIILRNEGLHESGSTSSVAVHNITQRMEKGTSKWQSKGKRNSRHMNRSIRHDLRSSVDADDESDGYLAGMEHLDGFSVESDMKGDSSLGVGSLTSDSLGLNAKSKTFREDQANGFPDWHKRADFTDAALVPQRSLPYRQSRFTVHPKYQMADFPTRNLRAECTLYDVNLEVQASYRPQHVPLVSLMSKLNGKAIIGHPLTVEVMEDGTTDQLIDNIEWYPTSSTSALHDTLIENDELGYVDAPNSEAVRVPTKHLMLQPRSSPSKSPKTKKSGLLLKKTRKLSSLTSCHKLREEKKPLVENLKGPAVACIPLKVVFSRLNEAVTGSARPMHRALVSSSP